MAVATHWNEPVRTKEVGSTSVRIRWTCSFACLYSLLTLSLTEGSNNFNTIQKGRHKLQNLENEINMVRSVKTGWASFCQPAADKVTISVRLGQIWSQIGLSYQTCVQVYWVLRSFCAKGEDKKKKPAKSLTMRLPDQYILLSMPANLNRTYSPLNWRFHSLWGEYDSILIKNFFSEQYILLQRL